MKAFEAEDPMALVGVRLGEAPDEHAMEEMAAAIVEEYTRLGWTTDQVLRLFRSRHFALAHHILEVKGEAFVQELAAAADAVRDQLHAWEQAR